MRSRMRSFFGSFARSDTKEKPQENVNKTAMMEVASLIKWVSTLLLNRNEVITKRQNPSRFAEVPKICCEVVFDIVLQNDTA